MQVLFLDPVKFDISSEKPARFDYGIWHDYAESDSESGEIHDPSKRNDAEKRVKTKEEYGFLAYCAYFLQSNRYSREQKANLLRENFGFYDIEVEKSEDILFIYEFRRSPIWVEIFLAPSGNATEIRRYDNENSVQIKLPVEFNGLIYVLCDIFSDVNDVKFDIDNLLSSMENEMIRNFALGDNSIIVPAVTAENKEMRAFFKSMLDVKEFQKNYIFGEVLAKIQSERDMKEFILESLHDLSKGEGKERRLLKAFGVPKQNYRHANDKNSFSKRIDGPKDRLFSLVDKFAKKDKDKLKLRLAVTEKIVNFAQTREIASEIWQVMERPNFIQRILAKFGTKRDKKLAAVNGERAPIKWWIYLLILFLALIFAAVGYSFVKDYLKNREKAQIAATDIKTMFADIDKYFTQNGKLSGLRDMTLVLNPVKIAGDEVCLNVVGTGTDYLEVDIFEGKKCKFVWKDAELKPIKEKIRKNSGVYFLVHE